MGFNLDTFKLAFKDCLPIIASYIVLGATFGILLNTAGYILIWAVIMSAFIYTGTMQFVAVNLLSAGASLATFAITTLAVSARQFLYSVSVIDLYKNSGKLKPYLIHTLTDESYTLITNNKERGANYFFFVSFIN